MVDETVYTKTPRRALLQWADTRGMICQWLPPQAAPESHEDAARIALEMTVLAAVSMGRVACN